eukprot:g5269.t1
MVVSFALNLMECIPFRRPRNQLAKLRKHRSIIFQTIPIEPSKHAPELSVLVSSTETKKNTSSVCLASGVVVQLPHSLITQQQQQLSKNNNSHEMKHKKQQKRTTAYSFSAHTSKRDVSLSTTKCKAISETRVQSSVTSPRKRRYSIGKGVWHRVRFLSCCGTVACDSSAGSLEKPKRRPLPTIYETESMSS